MFLAYVFGDIPPKYMTLYGTVAPFDDPKISIERMVIFPNILLAIHSPMGQNSRPSSCKWLSRFYSISRIHICLGVLFIDYTSY